MKKRTISKYVLMLLSIALLLQVLSACGKAEPTPTETTTVATTAVEETTTEANTNLIPLTADGKALYSVIRSEESTTAEFDAAKDLYAFIGEMGKVTATLSTDWIRRNSDPDAVSTFEILVGNTNRTASTKALGNVTGDTWCVTIQDERIVINASAGYLLADAVAHFKSMCTVVDGILMLDTTLCKREVLANALLGTDITLRVGTFNIKNGAQVGHDMSKIAEDILNLNLDIVGLQEVDICTTRAKGLDILKLLADATGYQYYAFTKAIDFQGGGYGTAILSRYPIVSHESVMLETPDGYEQRAYGHAVIEVNGTKLHFFNSHLSYEETWIRSLQFAQLSDVTDASNGYILTADFNTHDLSEFNVFFDAELVNRGQYGTYIPSSTAIDNIVLDEGWEIVDSGMVESIKSDHNLLWAEIHYKG